MTGISWAVTNTLASLSLSDLGCQLLQAPLFTLPTLLTSHGEGKRLHRPDRSPLLRAQ